MTEQRQTARRAPGRPVSAKSRAAAVRVATELLDERGYPGFSVDEVARRSGVSKATLYRHWRSGIELAVEAYGTSITDAVPVHSTGDVVADLTDQVRRLADVYAGPRGRVVAQILGAAVSASDDPMRLSRSFFAARRDATATLIRTGVSDGHLRADTDVELTIDLLFGPIVFRLFNGQPPVSANEAVVLGSMACRGILASRDGPRQPVG